MTFTDEELGLIWFAIQSTWTARTIPNREIFVRLQALESKIQKTAQDKSPRDAPTEQPAEPVSVA